jgi:hypothetical protein
VDFLRHHSLVVDVANLCLSAPPPVVGMITPGRSYADVVRSPPVVSAPAPAGGSFLSSGSSTPSPSPAAAATLCGWLAGQAGATPSPGHRLSATGIGPLPSRVQAIAEFPRPATVKQLQAFLGLFNFYR